MVLVKEVTIIKSDGRSEMIVNINNKQLLILHLRQDADLPCSNSYKQILSPNLYDRDMSVLSQRKLVDHAHISGTAAPAHAFAQILAGQIA